jgi:hypothetical protein
MMPVSYQGECVGLFEYPLPLLGNGSMNTFPWQRGTLGDIICYSIHIERLVFPRTSCWSIFIILKKINVGLWNRLAVCNIAVSSLADRESWLKQQYFWLYSIVHCFESKPEHQLSWLWMLWFSWVLRGKCLKKTLNLATATSSTSSFNAIH